jgi:MYXO-CTERM domain-containing protein
MTPLLRRTLRPIRPVLALCGCAMAAAAMGQVTGVAGSGQAFSNLQPSLAVTQAIALEGLYPQRDNASATGGTMGFVHAFAGSFAPRGMALADGRLLSISQNSAVFSILGTTYGGDGMRSFGLPNLAGRVVVGSGAGPGLTRWTEGERFGSSTVTLSQAQMPAHQHALPGGGVTEATGGNSPFFNAQPSLAMKRLIAVNGAFPGSGGSTPSVFIGQVATFAGYSTPSGWAEAAGQLLQIQSNTALFSLMGTSYGGNGITTFALPDLRGRVSIGASDQLQIGTVLGEEATTLQPDQLPAHTHSLAGGGTTGVAGASAPVDNLQPALALTPLIALEGLFPSEYSGFAFSPDAPMLGQIVEYAGTFAPEGWAIANGQVLAISDNERLFNLIGTAYGGDGVETFALPDLRGRTMVGTGWSFDSWQNLRVGDQMGSDSITLSLANLPPHLHAAPVPEPHVWALWLAGLAGLGVARRRNSTRTGVAQRLLAA